MKRSQVTCGEQPPCHAATACLEGSAYAARRVAELGMWEEVRQKQRRLCMASARPGRLKSECVRRGTQSSGRHPKRRGSPTKAAFTGAASPSGRTVTCVARGFSRGSGAPRVGPAGSRRARHPAPRRLAWPGARPRHRLRNAGQGTLAPACDCPSCHDGRQCAKSAALERSIMPDQVGR